MPTPSTRSAHRWYEFPPGVAVRIVASRKDVLAYFDAEYGHLAKDRSGEPQLDVYVGDYSDAVSAFAATGSDPIVYRRRHKVTLWKMALSGLDDALTALAFDGRGPMALPYLQAFYLEPLLRLKLLQAGYALVHGSCLIKGTTSVLLAGGSRVGKTTLALRHAAHGRPVQGDNYAIVSPEGETFAFPRRLRVYSDLRKTMPGIYQRLPLRERFRLRLAGYIKNFSLGYANPASRLSLEQLVPSCQAYPRASLDSVYVLRPHAGDDLLGPTPLSSDETIDRIQAHSVSEGRWLSEAISLYLAEHSQSPLPAAAEAERAILAKALDACPTYEVVVPRVTHAGVLARQLSALCGLDST